MQRGAREEETPFRIVLEEGLVALRLKILEDMSFVENTRLLAKLAK